MRCVRSQHFSRWLGLACVGTSWLGCTVYDASLASPSNGGASPVGPASTIGGAGGAEHAGGAAIMGGAGGGAGSADTGGAGANPSGAGGANAGAGGGASGDGGAPGVVDAGDGATDGGGGTGGSGGAAGSGGYDAAPDVSPPMPIVYVNHCSHVHWTATASSSDAGDVVAHAIDGYATTRWTTGRLQGGGTDFLQIDLGAGVTLSQVVLDNTGGSQDDYPRSYTVLLSTDGTTFPTTAAMAAVTTAPGAMLSIPFTSQVARAVKILNSGTVGMWWSVHEVRFTCQLVSPPPQGAIDPYDPVSWKATASLSEVNGPVANAIDSDTTTRWTTGQFQSGGETFTLDLGAVAAVSAVSLDAGGIADFPVAYALAVSVDGQAYESVAAGAGATFTRIPFPRKNARYLRVTQTGSSPNHWWSINEITITP